MTDVSLGTALMLRSLRVSVPSLESMAVGRQNDTGIEGQGVTNHPPKCLRTKCSEWMEWLEISLLNGRPYVTDIVTFTPSVFVSVQFLTVISMSNVNPISMVLYM